MSGYSGTPLAAKLGIKGGMAVQVANAPPDYRDLLAPLPGGASILMRPGGKPDLVHRSGLKLVVRKELRDRKAT